MKRELYEVLKKRITEVGQGSDAWEEFKDSMGDQNWTFYPNHPVFRVTLSDLGEGFFDICMQVKGRNLWNVAQRVCAVFSSIEEELEQKLLKNY